MHELPTALESRFRHFRENIVGYQALVPGPAGNHPLVYADWIASGRLYRPLEDRLLDLAGPVVANTHSESNWCGQAMTVAYREARDLIKAHVGARPDHVLLPVGSGMTGALGKLQRILGLKVPDAWKARCALPEAERPVVFITHMEHHSNHTSWLETLADVVVLPPGPELLVDPAALEAALEDYRDRPLKIGSFTAASNVTGIRTPLGRLARIMHDHGGWCFADFAANAPYDTIRMTADDARESLDAIFFSPHKFLGGPGSPGIVVFDKSLYRNRAPDQPGGGTVRWTNPWNEFEYVEDIESREDGGTPAFLQTIRAALSCQVKDAMGAEAMHEAEGILIPRMMDGLGAIPGIHLLAPHQRDRIGAISFYHEKLHYNLVVRLLSDRFGIQVRGGCSCAGTYGHYLLNVDQPTSRILTGRITSGDLSAKPGWVRLSLHPVTTMAEVDFMVHAIAEIARNGQEWQKEYLFDSRSADWKAKDESPSGIPGLWAGF